MTEALSLDRLAGRVADGAMLGLPPDYSFVPMAAVRALVRRGVRGLHLVTVPQAGIAADLLIGAGCVATVETAAVSLGELGNAPRFSAAVEGGDVAIRDSTCPAIHAALQAAEKGVPFMPLRGLIGSDLLRVRPDWQVIDNPPADCRSPASPAGLAGDRQSAGGLSITCQSGRTRSRSEPIRPRSGMKGTPFSAAWSAAWIAGQVESRMATSPPSTAALKRGALPSSPRLTAAVSTVATQPAPISRSAAMPACGTVTRWRPRTPRRTSARTAAIGTNE